MGEHDVLSLTPNPAVDKSTSIDRVAPEVKLRCEKPAFEPGGGGINVARVLHRLEVNCELLYPAGGPHGRFLESMLDGEDLRHTSVPIEEITRESYMVCESSSGQQYRFSHPGPDLRDEEWERILEHVGSFLEADTPYVVGSGSLPPGVPVDQYARIGDIVRDYGARFVLDTSGDFLESGLAGRPFLIKPNLRELGHIVDREIETDRDIVEASRQIVADKRADNIVVSLGAGGAFLINRDTQYRYRAPTVSIDSKVGAGDSMVGGILHGLLGTDSIRDAVRYGVAAGTAAVKTPGTELCHAGDVHEVFERVDITEL